jgi:hypothetical protein
VCKGERGKECRQRASHPNQNQRSHEYLQTSPDKREAFVQKKARQLDEHFEEHLNKGSESEQPTRPVDLRDDGVDIDLPSREDKEGALKNLKNNKATGADSIAAEPASRQKMCVLMTPKNDVSLEIQRRIQTANRCFFGLRKHLRSSHLSRQTKFTIPKTLI